MKTFRCFKDPFALGIAMCLKLCSMCCLVLLSMVTFRCSESRVSRCSNNPARRQGFRSQISDQYYLTSRYMAPYSFRGRRFSEHRRTNNNAAQRLHSFWGLVCVSICVASAAWRSSDGIISAVQGPEFLSVVGQGPKKQVQSIW